MKNINGILLLIVVAISACNTNSIPNNNSGVKETATDATGINKQNADSNTVKSTNLLIDRNIHIDNLDCPVCRKSLVKGFKDTTSYLGKTIGFDCKKCEEDFLKNSDLYKIK